MSKAKLPVIIFVSAVYPSQHSLLCKYLRDNRLADSWFMTCRAHVLKYAAECDHLLSFDPDGNIMGKQGYYYSSLVERSARICQGVSNALKNFEEQKGLKIDLIVAHGVWGSVNWLYDQFDAAIASYIEFPCYKAHGWDEKYPPDLDQIKADFNLEMLSFHQVLKSDLTITPSHYAKSLFPSILHDKIHPQFEGFDITPKPKRFDDSHPFTVGFAARDLSCSKGFETFVKIVDDFKTRYPEQEVRFVAMGDPKAQTYGYEQQWVKRKYNSEHITFCDHLLKTFPNARSIEFTGLLPYEKFSEEIHEVDVFLYPLMHGVANWGLMELLARGSCVIAANHGFCKEMIRDGQNGVLLDQNDQATWSQAIVTLKSNPETRRRYSDKAIEYAQEFHIRNAAPNFMELFQLAIAKRQVSKRIRHGDTLKV